MRDHATAAPVVGPGNGAVAVTRTPLAAVVAHRARCAILDVTLDSPAVRLTGAESAARSIRSATARRDPAPGTLVTRTSLADALAYALCRPGARRYG